MNQDLEKYIDQLTEQIEELIDRDKITDWQKVLSQDHEEDEELIEEYLEENETPLSVALGIEKVQLPPHERLNDSQIERLLVAMSMLALKYNIQYIFPEDITNRVKYRLLHQAMDDPISVVPFGQVGIEFCSYNIEQCPVPGDCHFCVEGNSDKGEKPNTNSTGDKIISDIHVYCNENCDLCNFTENCSRYIINTQIADSDGEMDMIEEDLMEEYVDNTLEDLGMTSQSLMDLMEDIGDDLFDVDAPKRPDHPLLLLAGTYSGQLMVWYDEKFELLQTTQEKLFNTSALMYQKFGYAVDAISAYFNVITDRLKTALDPNATYRLSCAKTALECIQENMNALEIFKEVLKDEENELIELLALLQKLYREVVQEIPEAESYIRPYLDE